MFNRERNGSATVDCLRISLANAEEIRSWSSGEVTQADMFDPLDGSPIEGGLYCESIFGTTHDWKCQCGKLIGENQKNNLCNICDHFPSFQPVRQTRMGHIELATPVVHPLFYLRTMDSPLAILLEFDDRDLRELVMSRSRLIVDPGLSNLGKHQLVSVAELKESQSNFGQSGMSTLTGASAVRHLLSHLDLADIAARLLRALDSTTEDRKRFSIKKRLAFVNGLRKSDVRPECLVIDTLPVISPELRRHDADVNKLYQWVVHRNLRLRKLINLSAPTVILEIEHSQLQKAVDALFDNERLKKPRLEARNGRALSSLSTQLRVHCKKRIDKRVDYSARSVVVPGPTLQLHHCGLPKGIALNLYEPFILRRLVDTNRAGSLRLARLMLERKSNVVWQALQEIMHQHPVVLSRPVLNKFTGTHAFEPVLVEGNAIHVNPLLSHQLEIDFSGQQIAVYLPLSIEAKTEATTLLLSPKNLLTDSFGELAMTLSKDVALGCYFLTMAKNGVKGEGMIFASTTEVEMAYERGFVDLHACVKLRLPLGTSIKVETELSEASRQPVETTVGRILFNEIMPTKEVYYCNEALHAKKLNGVLSDCHKKLGRGAFVKLLDAVKEIGFRFATHSGLSLGMQDLSPSPGVEKIFKETAKAIARFKRGLKRGVLSPAECLSAEAEHWSCTLQEVILEVAQEAVRHSSPSSVGIEPFKLYIWSRVVNHRSFSDIFPLLSGALLSLPAHRHQYKTALFIRFSLNRGDNFNPFIFINGAGRRKLKILEQSRRMDVGRWITTLLRALEDVVVTMEDCGDDVGISKSQIPSPFSTRFEVVSLREQIVGRLTLERIASNSMNEPMLDKDQMVTTEIAQKLQNMGIEQLRIRSPLTCRAPTGVCQKCNGADPRTNQLVDVGTAVGIQSALAFTHTPIGSCGFERLRQLLELRPTSAPMKLAEFDGTVEIASQESTTRARLVRLQGDCGQTKTYPFDSNKRLRVSHGQRVLAGDPLTNGAPGLQDILRILGPEAAKRFLLLEVQQVFQHLRHKMLDQHVELILAQLFRTQNFSDPNRSVQLIPLSIVKWKTSQLLKRLFVADPTKVVTQAALTGETDSLSGLRSNSIMGRLMQAGTGFKQATDSVT